MEPLAQAGYRVLAPDQRGYNLSDKPSKTSAYHLDLLAQDALGLLDHCQNKAPAIVVGHDWGAGVAWWLAVKHPQRLAKLIVMNVPHPKVFKDRLFASAEQRRKSGYIGVFLVPRLPGLLYKVFGPERAFNTLMGISPKGTFSQAQKDAYLSAWSQPGALQAMLRWYRAMPRMLREPEPPAQVHVPTLIIWGLADPIFEPKMPERSAALCDDARIVGIEGATHWVQHERFEEVLAALLDFLGSRRV